MSRTGSRCSSGLQVSVLMAMRDRMRGWVLASFLTLPLASELAVAKDKKEPMSAAELKTLLTGNSLAGNGKDNIPAEPYDWIAFYGADGVLEMRLKPTWGGKKYLGRWWLMDDGQFCRNFGKIRKQEGCWRMYREPRSLRFEPSRGKAVEGNAIMLPGNQVARIAASK